MSCVNLAGVHEHHRGRLAGSEAPDGSMALTVARGRLNRSAPCDQ
jgi:hypothetical protein